MRLRPEASNSRQVIIYFGLLLLTMALIGIGLRVYTRQIEGASSHEQLFPIDESATGIQKDAIEVGVVVDNIYNFDANQKTFDANGWLWLKWSPAVDARMKAAGVTPEMLFDFFNSVGDWDTSLKSATESPRALADGRRYQRFGFAGHFYANDLDFRFFPFQTIRLPLAIDIDTGILGSKGVPLPLKLDHENSGVGAFIDLSGYLTNAYNFSAYEHRFASTLGDPGFADTARSRSQARLEVTYSKSPVTIFIKIILPLLTIMGISLSAPAFSSANWDVRVGIPPTSILTLIFLQQTYQGWLPDLSYVTYLDAIYNICYFINLILFAVFLWSSNIYSTASDEAKQGLIERIDRIDLKVQVSLSLLLIFCLVGNWVFILHQPIK